MNPTGNSGPGDKKIPRCVDQVFRDYEKSKVLYEKLVKLTMEECEHLLRGVEGNNNKEKGIKRQDIKGVVQGRVKKMESLKKKLNDLVEVPTESETSENRLAEMEKDSNEIGTFKDWISQGNNIYEHPDMGDLAGVRIGLYFPDDIPMVAQKIEKHFNITHVFGTVTGGRYATQGRNLDPQKHNWGQWHSPGPNGVVEHWEHYGYKSWQVVVEWDEELDKKRLAREPPAKSVNRIREKMNAVHSLKPLRVEIQLGTVVTQAWAEVQHNIIYKNPNNISSTPTMKRMIDAINGLAITTDIMLKELQGNIKDAEKEAELRKSQPILDWLSGDSYVRRHGDNIDKHEEGTGKWLLHSPKYKHWFKTSNQTLVCHGIPGAGKTILTSIVIENLITYAQRKSSICIAYFYFTYLEPEKQEPEDVLKCLLRQLSDGHLKRHARFPDSVENLYNTHKNRKLPSIDTILRVFQSVADTYERVFIFIDALDECQALDGKTKFLESIKTIQAQTTANIFLTSRDLPEITDNFKDDQKVRIRAREDDVRKFLDGKHADRRLQNLVDSKTKRNEEAKIELKEEIKTKICRAVDGIFLLASLFLNFICVAEDEDKIRQNLKELPKSAGEACYLTYEYFMDRIQKQREDQITLAKRALTWIFYAKKPLTTLELQYGLAVQAGDLQFENHRVKPLSTIVSVCHGLVKVDKKSNTVQLVHRTAQEHFEKVWKSQFPNAMADITTSCVTYLSFDHFKNTGVCQTNGQFEERLQSYPLYKYAAQNWGLHAHEASIPNEQVMDFLQCGAALEASCQALMVDYFYSLDRKYSQKFPRQVTGLHLAAHFGLTHEVKLLLDGSDLNGRDSYGRTPLWYATYEGHETTAKFLIDKGVDVNISGSNRFKSGSPLCLAAFLGRQAMVKLLLKADNIDVNANGYYYGVRVTPLGFTAFMGHNAISMLLLQKDKIKVNAISSIDDESATPLCIAAFSGHEAIVELLLKADNIDVNANSSFGPASGTPLCFAAIIGSKSIVELLLKRNDIKVNAIGSFYNMKGTPLELAKHEKHEAIVKVLENYT